MTSDVLDITTAITNIVVLYTWMNYTKITQVLC